MSATNRSDVRHPDDFYATPAWATRAILRHLDVKGKRVLEPGCGRGAIMKEIAEAGAHVVGIELDAERARAATAYGNVAAENYLETTGLPESNRFDFAIGNPPFSLALDFVKKALTQANTVAMLLRLNWLSSLGRATFHEENPSHVHILDRRPEFMASLKCTRKPVHPTATCGWFRAQSIEEVRPKACPVCGEKMSVITTDATDYAWFVWSPERVARWSILRRTV